MVTSERGKGSTAVVYCRVSTDDQAQNGASLEVQESRGRAYARAKGWKVIGVLRDSGFSGKSLDRPAVQRLMETVDNRRVQAVVVYRLDRLTRSIRDLGDLIGRFEKSGVALASVSESLDTSTPSGRLVINVLGSVAQWERENTAARITDALRHRKENGRVYGVVPLGFDRKGDRLVPNLKEQMIVCRVFADRKKGRTLGAIAEALNQDRVHTKQGGQWWASTISAILKNDIYAKEKGGTRR